MLTLGSGKLWYRPCFIPAQAGCTARELLEDPTITEIMVNGCRTYLLRESGTAVQSGVRVFLKEKLNDVIQQMAGYSNRMVNEASPIVDTRLADGSRVNIVLEPVAIDGSAVTIRKFPENPIGMEDLIRMGSITGSGRSTENTGAVRLQYFHFRGNRFRKDYLFECTFPVYSREERIITVEDSAELQLLDKPNLVRLNAQCQYRRRYADHDPRSDPDGASHAP